MDPKTSEELDNLHFATKTPEPLHPSQPLHLDKAIYSLPPSEKKGLLTRRGFLIGAGATAVAGLIGLDYLSRQNPKETPNPAPAPKAHEKISPPDSTASPTPETITPPSPATPSTPTTPATSPEPTPPPPQPTPETITPPSCTGEFLAGDTAVYIPGTATLSLPKGVGSHTVVVEGYSVVDSKLPNPYRYKVKDPNTNKEYEIPIKELKVFGDPIPEDKITPNPFLGIRVDDPALIPEAKKMGVSKIRIELGGAELLLQNTVDTIRAAKDNNLEIVLAFHPTEPQPKQELSRRLARIFSTDILGDYPKVDIELGNEADNLRPDENDPTLKPYWKGGDMNTFADFIKLSSEAIRAIPGRENTRLIIGALIFKENYKVLLNNLIQRGIDLNQYTVALHTYDGVADFREKIGYVKNLLTDLNTQRIQKSLPLIHPPLWVTELGVNNPDKTVAIQMLEDARKSGISAVLLHQLAPYKNFGFLDQPSFNLIQCYSQNTLKKAA